MNKLSNKIAEFLDLPPQHIHAAEIIAWIIVGLYAGIATASVIEWLK